MPKLDDPGMAAFQAWLDDPTTAKVSIVGRDFPNYTMPTGWTYQPQFTPPPAVAARPSGLVMDPPAPVAGGVGTEIIATQPIERTLPIGSVGPPQPAPSITPTTPPVVAPPPPTGGAYGEAPALIPDGTPLPQMYMPEVPLQPTGPRLVPQVNIPLVLNTGDFGDPGAQPVPVEPVPVPATGGGGGATEGPASDTIADIPEPPKELMWWQPSGLHPQLAPWGAYLREMLGAGDDVASFFAQDAEIEELAPTEQEKGAPGYMSTRDVVKELRSSMNINPVEGETHTAQWQRVINALPSADLRTRQLLSSLRMTQEGKWFTQHTELLQNPRYL